MIMAGLEDPHLGGAYPVDGNTHMPDVWSHLLEKYPILSVADIGCGFGATGRWFLDRRIKVTGIEGDSVALNSNQLPIENLIPHDYTTGPLTIPQTDLACARSSLSMSRSGTWSITSPRSSVASICA